MFIVRLKDNLRLHLKRLVFLYVFTLLILPTICSATTNTTTNTTTSGSTTNTGVYYKNPDINTIQKGYKVTTDTAMTVDFTGTNYRDTSCYVLNSNTANPIFVPTRTEAEWLEFYNWARNPNNGVTIVPCKATYTDTWSAGSCSTTCGSGTIQGAVCSGTNCDPAANPNGSSCSSYATCSCPVRDANALFCIGQNVNFTSIPPGVTYINRADTCDGVTKCQAKCNSGYQAGVNGCTAGTKVNGRCGTDVFNPHIYPPFTPKTVATMPSMWGNNLCGGGTTPSAVNDTGTTWSWTCSGLYGGDNVDCDTPKTLKCGVNTECTGTWSFGTNCSVSCGTGLLDIVCTGGNGKCDPLTKPTQQYCKVYTACTCAAPSNATLCSGQDSNFSAMPPSVSYVDSGACDGSIKCQASCNSGYVLYGNSCIVNPCSTGLRPVQRCVTYTHTGTGCDTCPLGTYQYHLSGPFNADITYCKTSLSGPTPWSVVDGAIICSMNDYNAGNGPQPRTWSFVNVSLCASFEMICQ